YAIHVHRLQELGFNKRNTVGSTVRLTSARINHPGFTILVPASFEDRQRPNGIHLKIFKWLLHRLDMADVSSEIEYVSLAANKPPGQFHVAVIAFDYLNVLLNWINVEEIRPAGRMYRIQYCDGGAVLNKSNGEIASNEAEATGD